MAPNSSENPLGLVSIDHLEFTSASTTGETSTLFNNMGFQKSFENKNLEGIVFSQGSVHFSMIASQDKSSYAKQYFDKHGEGVSKISFLVKNAEHALKEAVSRGATEVSPLKVEETEHGVFKTASIQGFGDVLNEFIER
ncbi:MAG: VOC family protein, partial [Bdellovibrionota bacterium]|nr:VOC family protein [Bdellovibrionota bacterium]